MPEQAASIWVNQVDEHWPIDEPCEMASRQVRSSRARKLGPYRDLDLPMSAACEIQRRHRLGETSDATALVVVDRRELACELSLSRNR